MIEQYFNIWPTDTGLDSHFFMAQREFSAENDQDFAKFFISPRNQSTFKVPQDCRMVPVVTGVELLIDQGEAKLAEFLSKNRLLLMDFWEGIIDATQLKERLYKVNQL